MKQDLKHLNFRVISREHFIQNELYDQLRTFKLIWEQNVKTPMFFGIFVLFF